MDDSTLRDAVRELEEREKRLVGSDRELEDATEEDEVLESFDRENFRPTHTIGGVPVMMVRSRRGFPVYLNEDGRRVYTGKGRPAEVYTGPVGKVQKLTINLKTLSLCSYVASGKDTYADDENGSSAHYRRIGEDDFVELQMRSSEPPYYKRWLLKLPETVEVPAIEIK